MRVKTYFNQLEDDRTGKSTVVSMDEEYVYLKCDCGSDYSLKLTNSVKNEGNYMCRMCYAERDSANFDKHWGYKSAYQRIRKDARSSGRVFEIELDEFRHLSQQNCYYCGGQPNNLITYRSKNAFTFRYFVYSGLDRINNEIGYTRQNVVPCCIICNRAKNSMPFKDFIDWINKLVAYRQEISDDQKIKVSES